MVKKAPPEKPTAKVRDVSTQSSVLSFAFNATTAAMSGLVSGSDTLSQEYSVSKRFRFSPSMLTRMASSPRLLSMPNVLREIGPARLCSQTPLLATMQSWSP